MTLRSLELAPETDASDWRTMMFADGEGWSMIVELQSLLICLVIPQIPAGWLRP